MKKPLFWEMFLSLAIVGALNYAAVSYSLYWSISEFDSLVHFCGGVTLSLFFIWLYFFSGYFKPQKRSLKNFFIVSILGTIFVSISWEIFELILGEAKMYKTTYPFDTTMDFMMDILGSLAACFYAYIKEDHLLSAEVKEKNEQ